MTTEFDPSLYVRGVVADVPSAYSLGVSLLSAVPSEEERDSLVRRSARDLRRSVVALGDAWREAAKAGRADRRPYDAAADASWRALSAGLDMVGAITGTPEDDARAVRARSLSQRIFPEGLAFTQAPYTTQWAHAERILEEIDGSGLDRELEELIGPRPLAFVRRAHAAYGEALTITQPADGSKVYLREPLRGVQLAIRQYVFTLFAVHPPEDPKNASLLKAALAPIDAHRAAQARAPSPSEVEPSEPLPPEPPSEPVPPV
ncbi:MAG: hypothetical protein IT378_16675 [Sandaracinaceae bacterium]|nr:hypothetical protein [Sandaracinaceae bacterium]